MNKYFPLKVFKAIVLLTVCFYTLLLVYYNTNYVFPGSPTNLVFSVFLNTVLFNTIL